MLPRTLLLSICAAFALSACGGGGQGTQNDAGAEPDAAAANRIEPVPAPAPAATAQNAPDAPSTNGADEAGDGQRAIPSALHGRWALGAADCTKPRGAATGLMTVTADELRFFESKARPTGNIQSAGDSFSAEFAFEGEGQSWTSQQRLRRMGEELLRTDGSQAESIAYVRCR